MQAINLTAKVEKTKFKFLYWAKQAEEIGLQAG